MNIKNYRQDLDTLRALAIILVLIYHSPYGSILPGGYIGVDIFFVISGFLITPSVIEDIQNSRFSFKNFYTKRFFRLVPTLSAVILFVAFLSYYLSPPATYAEIPSIILSSLTLSSNEFFRMYSLDYFQAGELKSNPLLHLWSLSLEEQFYLIFPVLIFGLIKSKALFKIGLRIKIGLILVVSFLLAAFFVNTNPSLVFYSLPFRLWELLAGCVLAGISPPRFFVKNANPIYTISVVSLVILAIIYDHNTTFPGLTALPVVIFTALLILTGESTREKTRAFFINRPIRYTGQISYSLYLWHWPIFIFNESPALSGVMGFSFSRFQVIIVAIVVSVFSYHFIENKFRYIYKQLSSNSRKLSYASVAVFFIVSSYTLKLNSNDELYPNFSTFFPKATEAPYRKWQLTEPSRLELRIIGDSKAAPIPSIAFVGDSLTGMLGLGLDAYLKESKRSAYFLAYEGCPFIVGLKFNNEGCNKYQKAIWDFIQNSENIKAIVLTSRWTNFYDKRINTQEDETIGNQLFKNSLINLTEFSKKFNKKVFFIIPPQNSSQNNLSDYVRSHLSKSSKKLYLTEVNLEPKLNFFYQMIKENHFSLLNMNEHLCKKNQCTDLTTLTPIFHDKTHLNQNGSLFFKNWYSHLFKEII